MLERDKDFATAARLGLEFREKTSTPQHRAWRHAREEAAVRIGGFRHEQTEALQAAGELLNRYQPSLSQEWLDLMVETERKR